MEFVKKIVNLIAIALVLLLCLLARFTIYVITRIVNLVAARISSKKALFEELKGSKYK